MEPRFGRWRWTCRSCGELNVSRGAGVIDENDGTVVVRCSLCSETKLLGQRRRRPNWTRDDADWWKPRWSWPKDWRDDPADWWKRGEEAGRG